MLICSHCNKQHALIHVAEAATRDGKKFWDIQHLCEGCAHELGLPHAKSVELFQSFPIGVLTDLKCPQCGLRLSDFRRTGRLGCEKCYEAFKEPLQDVLEKAHAGKTHHVGRAPGMSGEEASRREDLAALQRKLRQAVESEAYEEAARLRDKIRSIDPQAS
jgi:protein arginine kinase activator